jgi:hypothetical protein
MTDDPRDGAGILDKTKITMNKEVPIEKGDQVAILYNKEQPILIKAIEN